MNLNRINKKFFLFLFFTLYKFFFTDKKRYNKKKEIFSFWWTREPFWYPQRSTSNRSQFLWVKFGGWREGENQKPHAHWYHSAAQSEPEDCIFDTGDERKHAMQEVQGNYKQKMALQTNPENRKRNRAMQGWESTQDFV